jgi:ubiquinone/menaquinone biosynthesis C-methylase UbiE
LNVERDWRAIFEETYTGPPSLVADRVWRRVFGDEYPAGLDPFSLVSRSELERFASEVCVGEGGTIADLGCGRGGPGLWVAMATGARLVGVDIAENVLDAARARARSMNLGARAEFRRGSFDDTGLADGSVDAVMSVDALLFAVDKSAAAVELRRLLPAGGRLVFTSWDYHRQPAERPPQVDDHRPLLGAAGFQVLVYEETTDWRNRIVETTAGLMDSVDQLAAESGRPTEQVRAELVEMNDTIEAMSRRVFVVARAS